MGATFLTDRGASGGGRTIYIAPMAATDADSNVVGVGDLEAQARYIYRKLEIALDAAAYF